MNVSPSPGRAVKRLPAIIGESKWVIKRGANFTSTATIKSSAKWGAQPLNS